MLTSRRISNASQCTGCGAPMPAPPTSHPFVARCVDAPSAMPICTCIVLVSQPTWWFMLSVKCQLLAVPAQFCRLVSINRQPLCFDQQLLSVTSQLLLVTCQALLVDRCFALHSCGQVYFKQRVFFFFCIVGTHAVSAGQRRIAEGHMQQSGSGGARPELQQE